MCARLRHGVRGNGLSRTGRGMASSHGLLAFRHLRLTGLRQRRDAAGAGALIVVLFRQRNIRHIGHDALYLAGCTGRPGFAGTARNTRRTSSVCRYVHAVAGLCLCLRRASSGNLCGLAAGGNDAGSGAYTGIGCSIAVSSAVDVVTGDSGSPSLRKEPIS